MIAALCCLAFELFLRGPFPISATLVLVIAVITTLDMARRIRAVDESLSWAVNALSAAPQDLPTQAIAGLIQVREALRDAADRWASERRTAEIENIRLQAMLDTVHAALLVVEVTGDVRPANRAARQMIGSGAPSLSAIRRLGKDAAERLERLPVGGSEIVRLSDATTVFASSTGFVGGTEARLRLLSLQNISSELGAVEDRAWRDLIRVLAHEIMNSLTPIVTIAQSATFRKQPALRTSSRGAKDLIEGMEIIARRGNGLMEFIRRYREFADVPRANRSRVNVRKVALDVARLLAPAQGGLFRCPIKVEAPAIRADIDAELFELALINLLKNAAEATEQVSKPFIAVQIENDADTLVVRVCDNGAGLPDEDADRLFIPFFTTKHHGAGVGLSVVRQIMQAHNGQVSVDGRTDGGCVFTMRFPSAIAQSESPPRSAGGRTAVG